MYPPARLFNPLYLSVGQRLHQRFQQVDIGHVGKSDQDRRVVHQHPTGRGEFNPSVVNRNPGNSLPGKLPGWLWIGPRFAEILDHRAAGEALRPNHHAAERHAAARVNGCQRLGKLQANKLVFDALPQVGIIEDHFFPAQPLHIVGM